MRISILDIQKMKAEHRKIPMVTAYDATSAHLMEAAGIPMLLVGDSVGMVVQGHDTTLPVTLDDLIYHTRMVVRGTSQALIVMDLPFMTYKISQEQALTNAARAMQEGGCGAVKLEGGTEIAPTIERLTRSGIPVMAHIGLTPQSVHQLGGWKVQGKSAQDARRLLEDALQLEQAGAYAIVLETIPAPLAELITAKLRIPTIGIGAGPHCDGQVQVFHDLVGMYEQLQPRHAKRYADLATIIKQAISQYADEVRSSAFPTEAHSFKMDEQLLHKLYGGDDHDADHK